GRIDLADRGHLGVRLGEEVEEVALADEADPDTGDAHAVVGPEHPAAGGGRRQAGAHHGLQERAAGLHDPPTAIAAAPASGSGGTGRRRDRRPRASHGSRSTSRWASPWRSPPAWRPHGSCRTPTLPENARGP